MKDVLAQTPEAKGRLLIDLINEPDGYTLTWEVRLPLPSFQSVLVTCVTPCAVTPGNVWVSGPIQPGFQCMQPKELPELP